MKSFKLFNLQFSADEDGTFIWHSEDGDVDISELLSNIGGDTLEWFIEAEALAEEDDHSDEAYELKAGK